MIRTDPERDPVTAWAEDVVAGRILAGPHVRATAARHLRDLDEGPARGLRWNVDEALSACAWIEKYLCLKDGQFHGKPFILHPSQVFRIGALFGWQAPNALTGTGWGRRFRRFYDEEGKGNGKSPMLAAIGMIGLVREKEPGAQIYAAASKKDQARILFDDAVAMWEQSPSLKRTVKAHGKDPIWQMSYIDRGRSKRIFAPISSDDSKSGPRPSMALCDEVHEHRDRTTIDMLERGFKSRAQPLLAMATNAGTARSVICQEEHKHAVSVAAGTVEDDTTFSFVCSLDEGDDWQTDPSCWGKANPLLGHIIQPDFLARQVDQARKMPGKRNGIARLNFCEWTEAETAAVSQVAWMACVGEVSLEDLIRRGVPCFGGLDLSHARDFTAFTLLFVLDATRDREQFAAFTWFWTPKDTLADRSVTDDRPYDVWVRNGHIEAVPGQRISYRWMAEALAAICARTHPVLIGCDAYGLEQLSDHLAEIGVSLPVTVHPQGFQKRVIRTDRSRPEGQQEIYLWMPDSILKLENAIAEERIRIAVNPMMNSCAANVVYARNRSDHRMFDKDKATGRIDGMVSLAMATGVATMDGDVLRPRRSPYETRGVRAV